MKGLLKGLRYISQIFDPSVKEPEMQIGNPTDVKHVAHIGWDNASVTAPSWMNEFKPTAGGTESGGEPEASQAGGAEGDRGEKPGGGGGRADQAERPRRAGRGKERRDGGSEGSQRPPKTEVGENCEGEAAGAAPKQRRRKTRASGGTSSGRSKSSSGGGGGGGCGPAASDPQAARPAAAEDDDGDKCF